jgi:thioredoxin-related protein
MSRLRNTLLLLTLSALSNAGVQAAELIMFSSPDCSWCEAWERDVGAIFPRTQEGKHLQLTHVDISDPLPSRLKDLETVKYTPTFVVLDQGREVGRIAGYSGEDFFWWELQQIMKRLPGPEKQ